jgi:two-component sensor histidine kinase
MLSTLRIRLLIMILVVMVPAAVFIAVEARTTYDTALRALHDAHAMAAANVGMRIRLGLESSGRVLTTLISVADSNKNKQDCDTAFARALPFAPSVVAVRAHRPDGGMCAAVDPAYKHDAAALLGLPDTMDLPAPHNGQLPSALKNIQVGSGVANGVRYLVASVGGQGADSATHLGDLVIDLGRLTTDLRAAKAIKGANLALFDGGDLLLQLDGGHGGSETWLPASLLSAFAADGPVTLPGHDGETRVYVRSAVVAPNLFLVAGFDRAPERVVFRQFLALLLAPLATMLVLWLAYSRMIRMHVLRWTSELAAAARAVASNRHARAPDEPGMPLELREVGRSFNAMLERQGSRERSLEVALAHNQHLTLELHHRIKNSLQIVQSYIGLGKRGEVGAGRRALLLSEARVNALSTAYRLALADGELTEASIDDYLEAVASNVGALLLGPGQDIRATLAIGASSRIDLLTPLGLILVEALIVLLASDEPVSVTVTGQRQDNGDGLLTIAPDTVSFADRTDQRLLDGLIRQAGAERVPAAPGVLLALLLKPGP